MTSPFVISNVECLNLEKSTLPISTGLGFLDHMLDQFNSHAQVGVAISVATVGTTTTITAQQDHHNRHASSSYSQEMLQSQVGAALGVQLRRSVLTLVPDGATSRFCCPLDEALVECVVTKGNGKLTTFTLPPYGIYPRPHGRSKIGQMETSCIRNFMDALAVNSGLDIVLNKIRGDNGHHIVESAFKALSRALRNLLDGTNCTIHNTESLSPALQQTWGVVFHSESHQQGLQLQRSGKVDRTTKETSILVELHLDDHDDGGGVKGGVLVETGMATLNEFWTIMAVEANMGLTVQCKGDLWVDDHHTSEDIAIAVGQVLTKALGTKAGLNRMWCAQGQIGEAVVEVTMDLSNRPCLTQNLTLADCGEEYVGDSWTVEMFEHVLESLVMNGHMTVHVVELTVGKTVKETVMATAMAFGRALRFCAAIDPRRAGTTASSKGTLSA